MYMMPSLYERLGYTACTFGTHLGCMYCCNECLPMHQVSDIADSVNKQWLWRWWLSPLLLLAFKNEHLYAFPNIQAW